MPSTVASLFASVGLEPEGSVAWAVPVPETRTGVYVVSLTASPTAVGHIPAKCPVDKAALDALLSVCPTLTLDHVGPTRRQLAKRIASYWLADEPVLYIGLAGQPLRTRVRQYYTTPLGAAKPHKGGWWLKTLSVLDQLYVHFATTDEFKDAEEEMMRAFARDVSTRSRAALPLGDPVMPFANLRDGDWRRRQHGIHGETSASPARTISTTGSASARSGPKPGSSVPAAASHVRASGRRIVVSPDHSSRPVSASDIGVGQVRISGATKAILPRDRTEITVVLRGRELTCRWDPRDGPPERSGVVRVGRQVARELLSPMDVLRVSKVGGTFHLT